MEYDQESVSNAVSDSNNIGLRELELSEAESLSQSPKESQHADEIEQSSENGANEDQQTLESEQLSTKVSDEQTVVRTGKHVQTDNTFEPSEFTDQPGTDTIQEATDDSTPKDNSINTMSEINEQTTHVEATRDLTSIAEESISTNESKEKTTREDESTEAPPSANHQESIPATQDESGDLSTNTEVHASFKPIKRKYDDSIPSYDPIDPTAFHTETSKRRVAGKLIERFWEPLDSRTHNSFDRILNMCLNRTIEKYKTNTNNTKLSKKMIDAQSVISKNWTNEMSSRSFKSRLNVTSVPLPTTMQTLLKHDPNFDILNYDHLTRHMQFLETYLLAELRQLTDLETYYSELETMYNLDLNYLNEFKKTTSKHQSKMIKDTIAKRENLNLTTIEPSSDNIKLAHNDKSTNSTFNPNADEDTRGVLSILESHLESLTSNTSGLTTLNEKLETLYNSIND